MSRKIFVFGSNLAGIHGKGAALYAAENYGAKRGQGEGLQGDSYAIPTKDEKLKTLPVYIIRSHVDRFIAYAKVRLNWEFLVTAIGTGLAGYNAQEIAPLFREAPENCQFIRPNGEPNRVWEKIIMEANL